MNQEERRVFARSRCPHCKFWLVGVSEEPNEWFCTACGALIEDSGLVLVLETGASLKYGVAEDDFGRVQDLGGGADRGPTVKEGAGKVFQGRNVTEEEVVAMSERIRRMVKSSGYKHLTPRVLERCKKPEPLFSAALPPISDPRERSKEDNQVPDGLPGEEKCRIIGFVQLGLPYGTAPQQRS